MAAARDCTEPSNHPYHYPHCRPTTHKTVWGGGGGGGCTRTLLDRRHSLESAELPRAHRPPNRDCHLAELLEELRLIVPKRWRRPQCAAAAARLLASQCGIPQKDWLPSSPAVSRRQPPGLTERATAGSIQLGNGGSQDRDASRVELRRQFGAEFWVLSGPACSRQREQLLAGL